MNKIHCFLHARTCLLLSEDLSLRSQYELLQTFSSLDHAKLFLDKISRQYKLPIKIDVTHDDNDTSIVIESSAPDPEPSIANTKRPPGGWYKYIPAYKRKIGSRPKTRDARLREGWVPPNPYPKGSKRSEMNKARLSIAKKVRHQMCWRLWFTNGDLETNVLFPKDQYATPDDCPPPHEGWYRGRSVHFKRKMAEWKDDWHAALWSGSAAKKKGR
jgi:hypothetical protein